MGVFGALWGLGGLTVIFLFAILRLYPYVIEALSFQFHWYHWLALVLNILFMAYSEGYRGFQKGFSPRVAARARHLLTNPSVLPIVFSPFFCASYFHSSLRRKFSILLVTLCIVGLVMVVSRLAQPWRGIVDAGVMVGLGWGILTIFYYGFLALTAKEFEFSADLPPGKSGQGCVSSNNIANPLN